MIRSCKRNMARLLRALTGRTSGRKPQNRPTEAPGHRIPLLIDCLESRTLLSAAGPITITHGGTYQGDWQSLNAKIPAVRIRTSEPVIIENSTIRSRGILIDASGFNANLTVRDTSGYGLNPNVNGQRAGRFLDVDGFSNVVVSNNYLEGTAGIYLARYKGNHTAKQTITVLGNVAKNIDGRMSNGKGGYLNKGNDDDYVQFFQVNGAHHLRGAEVAWNQVTNEPGKSLVEDNINIFDTTGTADSRFVIHDNYIQGAYPIDPAKDRNYTGGGIMVSDVNSSFISAYDNQVIDTTNYGIAISSGHDNEFYDNRIVSAGMLPDGRKIKAQNVGAYIWNQSGKSGFTHNVGHDNVIGWVGSGGRNDWWTPDAASWNNNQAMSGKVELATVQGEWTIWQNKLAQDGMSVGLEKA